MLNDTQAQQVIGSTAYTQDGSKLGKVGQLFVDDNTGQPEFVTVSTGLFGTRESYVPVGQATFEDGNLTLPYTKDQVKDAPNVDVSGGHLDESEEQRLYQHYGLTWNETSGTGYGNDDNIDTDNRISDRTDGRVDTNVGHDTSGPTTDDAMTRSEERLEVGTETRESGRARLRKHVTTSTETATVPVAKERAVVTREPVTDANIGSANAGPSISEEEHEVVLHEEEAVVNKVATPVERVSLGTETTTEEKTITEDVRKEEIEVDGDVDDRRS